MVKKKQHEKVRYATFVKGPDGTLYNTERGGDVTLVRIHGRKGMWWSHNSKDIQWRKIRGDEIKQRVN